jgi:hypothetical protein
VKISIHIDDQNITLTSTEADVGVLEALDAGPAPKGPVTATSHQSTPESDAEPADAGPAPAGP